MTIIIINVTWYHLMLLLSWRHGFASFVHVYLVLSWVVLYQIVDFWQLSLVGALLIPSYIQDKTEKQRKINASKGGTSHVS